MSKDFAIRILDGMVDASGHCGERGMSEKQFNCIAPYLVRSEEPYDINYWQGQRKSIYFEAYDWVGKVGPYDVVLQERQNWSVGYAVKSISPRPEGEWEAEQAAERRGREARDFSGSEWVGQPKKRLDLTLTLVSAHHFERMAYNGYGTEIFSIYTMRDADGNCFVWKTTSALAKLDREDSTKDVVAEVGDVITMRATVKEHSTYRGTKQTVIVRPAISAIRAA